MATAKCELALGANHIRVQLDGIRLTSKLIDGRFPEYSRVVPNQPKNVIKADRNLFRQALQRTAILSNEKYRGVRLELSANSVILQANNPEQEEAVETLEVEYSGDAMEIGFNVNYLLDALGGRRQRASRVRRDGRKFELLDPRAGRRPHASSS